MAILRSFCWRVILLYCQYSTTRWRLGLHCGDTANSVMFRSTSWTSVGVFSELKMRCTIFYPHLAFPNAFTGFLECCASVLKLSHSAAGSTLVYHVIWSQNTRFWLVALFQIIICLNMFHYLMYMYYNIKMVYSESLFSTNWMSSMHFCSEFINVTYLWLILGDDFSQHSRSRSYTGSLCDIRIEHMIFWVKPCKV